MTWHKVIETYRYDGSLFRPVDVTSTPGPGPDAPTTPTGLDYTALTTSSVTVTWTSSTPGAGDGIAGYAVEVNGVVRPTLAGGPSVTLTGLPQGQSQVRVAAVADSTLRSAWSSPLLVSPLTAPATGGAVFGYHVKGNNGTYPDYVGPMGKPKVYRFYRTAGQSTASSTLPWPVGGGLPSDISYMYSWKPTAAIASGSSYWSMMDDFMSRWTLDLPLWWVANHEPENGDMTGPDFVNRFHAFSQRVRQFGNPLIIPTICMVGWQLDTMAKYIPPLEDIGCWTWDPYIQSGTPSYNSGRAVFDRIVPTFADQYLPGVPLGIGEFGIVNTLGTDAQRAECIRGFQDRAKEIAIAKGAAPFCYFNGDGGIADASLLQSPLAMARWKAGAV